MEMALLEREVEPPMIGLPTNSFLLGFEGRLPQGNTSDWLWCKIK